MPLSCRRRPVRGSRRMDHGRLATASLANRARRVCVADRGELPPVPELCFEGTMECLQMVLPETVTPAGSTNEIVRLSNANAPEMVALTTIAFPGFFRSRTSEIGSYYGIRSDGELIAIGGQRLRLAAYSESSC